MNEMLVFRNKEEFHDWLLVHNETSAGVWLLFTKKGAGKSITANEALEEALCFGWIDGVIHSLNSTTYKKYFAKRRLNSKWSKKNKIIAENLLAEKRMQKQGIEAVEQAKKNGQWNQESIVIDESKINEFKKLIQINQLAYSNLVAMSPSVHKTYTSYYFDAKSDKTRQNRLEKIINRLIKNLKPMDKEANG